MESGEIDINKRSAESASLSEPESKKSRPSQSQSYNNAKSAPKYRHQHHSSWTEIRTISGKQVLFCMYCNVPFEGPALESGALNKHLSTKNHTDAFKQREIDAEKAKKKGLPSYQAGLRILFRFLFHPAH